MFEKRMLTVKMSFQSILIDVRWMYLSLYLTLPKDIVISLNQPLQKAFAWWTMMSPATGHRI